MLFQIQTQVFFVGAKSLKLKFVIYLKVHIKQFILVVIPQIPWFWILIPDATILINDWDNITREFAIYTLNSYYQCSFCIMLSTESERGIFREILQGKLDFQSEPWPGISESAKDLIRKMLDRNPKKRPTAHEVLCKPLSLYSCVKQGDLYGY